MGFGHTVRTFWFTTPPKPGPDVPYKFGLIGNEATPLFVPLQSPLMKLCDPFRPRLKPLCAVPNT
jgi:hypothetical protein